MDCPTCERRIVWRDDKYIRCCECGLWCPITGYVDEEYNLLIGDWSDEEIAKLEAALAHYCDMDFVFFKGRNIITAWRDRPSERSNRVVMARSLDRLIKML